MPRRRRLPCEAMLLLVWRYLRLPRRLPKPRLARFGRGALAPFAALALPACTSQRPAAAAAAATATTALF